MKRFTTILVLIVFMVALQSPEMLAQGPNMPTNPDQTPIDGGLGLLALSGGVYAVRRLRQARATTPDDTGGE